MSKYMRSCVALIWSVIVFSANQSFAAPPADPTFEITLRPVREGGPEVSGIEVRAVLSDVTFNEKQPFGIRAPITYVSVTGIADRIQKLEVRDPSGVVPLTIENDKENPGGFPYYRHWIATRAVVSPVVITYRSLPQTTPPVLGPQFSFRSQAGGFSSAGSGFLALPEKVDVKLTRVKWDLSDLAKGSVAASSFGEGDFERKGSPEQLTQGYFMVGPVGHFEPKDGAKSFAAYWQGKPPFEPETEMAWAYKSYSYQKKFFGNESLPTYRVFIRVLPGAGGGGTALQHSFMVATNTNPNHPSIAKMKTTISHEMMHMFIGGIEGKEAGPWYHEGLTEYYTHLLLLRSGLLSVDDYLRNVNVTASDYYSNPFRNTPAASLDKIGFSEGVGAGSAQNVPYNRGRLYFALVDSKIRAASGGKRKLDDVILPLFEKRSRGEPFDVATLLRAFEKEYGPDAHTDFRNVNVLGEPFVPPSDAFGKGFERREKKYTVKGKEVDGYEWSRLPSISDEACRDW